MGKIRIITDSASDITAQEEKKYNIHIIPFPVTIGDKSYMSRVDFDNQGFYELMEEYPDEIPKTAQITSFQFEEIMKQQFEEGYTDLIFVSINAKASATNGNAIMAANQLMEDYPEYRENHSISVFDGVGYTGMYGELCINAAKMAQENKSVEEIKNYLSSELKNRRIYFGIYMLRYAAKSGRIPSAAALVGDALGVKPVMRICDNEIVTAAKCRGEKKLISKIIDMSLADMKPGSPYQIVYGNDEACLEEMKEKATEALGYPPSNVYQIGAAIATNSGPKVVGLIFSVKDELRK